MIDEWSEANAAARSVHVLMGTGDTRGAINRAYYAMFHAARVALTSIAPDLAEAKTHATIIGRFGKHLVKERGLDSGLGRIFAQTEDARIAADYEGERVEDKEARLILQGMDRFLAAVEEFLRQANP